MPGVGEDQHVTGAAVPRCLPCPEPDPAAQNLNGGFPRVLMLIEGRTRGQGNDRLPQRMLMSAEHRLGAAPARCGPSPLSLLTGDGIQGELLHTSQFPGGCEGQATRPAAGLTIQQAGHHPAGQQNTYSPRCYREAMRAVTVVPGQPGSVALTDMPGPPGD